MFGDYGDIKSSKTVIGYTRVDIDLSDTSTRYVKSRYYKMNARCLIQMKG